MQIRRWSLTIAVFLMWAFHPSGDSQAAVLLVCNAAGCPGGGQFTSIQSAVDAAQPEDWILVWPGTYHEKGSDDLKRPAGVLVTTPNLHIRGLDRNLVVVDGTNSVDASCSNNPSLQDFGPVDSSSGKAVGRNGIEVFKASGTSVENLTVCNYLGSDAGENGNEIWWNGGDGSGHIGLHNYTGSYLSATSTYFKDFNSAQAKYGLFASNADGPGLLQYSYASNMGDSDFYVGACPDCNAVLDHVHAQYSSLGYSGTNGGGHLIIRDSEFDNNKSGVVPNTLNNDDAPSPQSGLCPNGETGPTGTRSCMIIENNYVHDNNNPNVPASGISGAAPVGAGIEISAGKFDTIIHNRVEHQGAWGIVIHDFPDTGPPPAVADCNGGISGGPTGICYFQAEGNEVASNFFVDNGSFGNPSNGDLANAGSGFGNCFHDNTDSDGHVTSAPPLIETVDSLCNGPTPGDETVLTAELICASQIFGPCPDIPGLTHYPRTTTVVMPPLTPQENMPDPCGGVPANPWCPYRGPKSHMFP